MEALFFDLNISSDCLKNFFLTIPRPMIAGKTLFCRFRGLGLLEKLYFIESEASDRLKYFILPNTRPRIV